MPFDFSPLSMDFPALCLQCLESPLNLLSSTPHSTASSWSITPPGKIQNEALKIYFREELRKWKILCSAATTRPVDELAYLPPQAVTQQETANQMAQKAVESAKKLERQLEEHLEESFKVWEQLSPPRRQELWILEMARNIGKGQKEVVNLKEVRHSLKLEIAHLKSQIDHLNKQQQPEEFKIMPPMTLRMDENMAQLWSEAGISGRRSTEINHEDRQDLNTMVSGAIERWKSVIVTSRAANANKTQRPLDQISPSLKTITSVAQPLSPEESRPAQQHRDHRAEHSHSHLQLSPSAEADAGRDAFSGSAGLATTTGSEPKTSAASTPTQSADDSDEDADADDDADADADADVEMEVGSAYFSTAHIPTHHTILQLPQNSAQQQHQMQPVTGTYDQHISAMRHNSYPQRDSHHGQHSALSIQQMHMSQQAFGHQLQTLEHHLAQGHSMGWSHNH